MATKSTVRWSVVAAIAVATVGGIAYLMRPTPVVATITTVRRGFIADAVSDQGTARVRQSYTISAPVGGRVERLALEVGDRVVAGQTIAARLRPTPVAFLDARARTQAEAAVAAARAAVDAARADRERANAALARANTERDRVTALLTGGAASAQQADDARADAKTARAAADAAAAMVTAREADLVSAQAALSAAGGSPADAIDVRSPASGVVTRVTQQSERSIPAGTPLVEIGDVGGLEAQIEFLSQDAARIRPGMAAEVYDWGGGAIAAEVRRVEPQAFTKVSALGVEEQRVLVMLQFTCPPADWAGLAPGYRVWGRVFLRREANAVLVPVGALVREAGGWAVFVVAQHRATLTPVRIGAISDADAEVLEGLAPGARVVTYPSDQVHDGVLLGGSH